MEKFFSAVAALASLVADLENFFQRRFHRPPLFRLVTDESHIWEDGEERAK